MYRAVWCSQREQEEEEARLREEEENLATAKMKHLRLQEERREQDRIALAEQQAARADKVRRPTQYPSSLMPDSLILPQSAANPRV